MVGLKFSPTIVTLDPGKSEAGVKLVMTGTFAFSSSSPHEIMVIEKLAINRAAIDIIREEYVIFMALC